LQKVNFPIALWAITYRHKWQAIMDHLRSLPVRSKGELPVIPVDERAAEVRAIKAGWRIELWTWRR